MKPCIKCGAIDRGKNGNCRPCRKIYNKAYHAANSEKKKAYRAANSEKIKAYGVAYYAANSEKKKA